MFFNLRGKWNFNVSNIQKYFKKESEGPVNKGEEATYSAETGSLDEGEKDMSIEDSVNESYSINESPSETEV